MAALLPVLELGVVARRHGSQADDAAALDQHGERRWSTAAFVGFSFRASTVAGQLPLRTELAPETWIAPCDEDDVLCLEEALSAEAELAGALGELQ